MGLLFNRKCVEDFDITPRLGQGRVYVEEQQKAMVMSTMINGHAILSVFPAGEEDEGTEMITSVEEALKMPIKKKRGEWLVYEVFAGEGNLPKILKTQQITTHRFGLAYGDDFLNTQIREFSWNYSKKKIQMQFSCHLNVPIGRA